MAEIIRWVQESKIADIAALEALESDQRLHWIQGRMQTYNSLLEVMQKPNEFLLEFEEDKTGKEKSKRSMAAF